MDSFPETLDDGEDGVTDADDLELDPDDSEL
jgi:hypothetical protein